MQDDVIAMVTTTGGEKEDPELVETPDRMLPVIWTEMIGDSPRTTDYKDISENMAKGMENGFSLQLINSMGFFVWLATLEQDHNHNRDGLVTDTK